MLVVVTFDGTIKCVVEDDGQPSHYDLEDNQCFVRYVVDEQSPPISRIQCAEPSRR